MFRWKDDGRSNLEGTGSKPPMQVNQSTCELTSLTSLTVSVSGVGEEEWRNGGTEEVEEMEEMEELRSLLRLQHHRTAANPA